MCAQKKKSNHSFIFLHGLTITFFVLFLLSLFGQAYNGWHEYNDERAEYMQSAVGFSEYLHTGHFIQATFENWESEFFQMALFVVLTIFLRERGSSESKDVDDPFFDNKELQPKAKSTWPVKKGGIILLIYKNSLSIALGLLFLVSFVFHVYGSYLDQREHDLQIGNTPEKWTEFLSSSKLWFESLQNWQSEFLSVFAIILL